MHRNQAIMSCGLFVLMGALSRLLPHLPNMTPVISFAVIAGMLYSRVLAVALMLLTLLLSDVMLSVVYQYPVVGGWTFFSYSGLLIIVAGAMQLKPSSRLRLILLAGMASSLFFWVWTNFGVWLSSGMYPKSWLGLWACYDAALIFLRNQFIGTMAWLLFLSALVHVFFGNNKIQWHIPVRG